MNRYLRMLFERKFRFSVLSKYGFYNWMADEAHIKRKFKLEFGKELNLNDPQTYNEKLQWLKLFDRRPEYTKMVDKFESKEFIAERIGSSYVVPVVGGPWDLFDEINFDNLPDQFVLKTTHDCGGVFICQDKSKMDFEKARKFLKKHLKSKYYLTCREWPYKNVKPRIFAEVYIKDAEQTSDVEQLTDYKFFCFDGQPRAMFIATDRADKNTETKFDFFDMEFNHLPIVQGHPNSDKKISKPWAFDKMKEIAAVLSKGIPQVRVDFYCTKDQIYVGELTLFHFGGFVPFKPYEWDFKFGEWISLKEKRTENK